MERPAIDTRTRDWYSVSVDTLRAWGIVLALAALVAVGFFGYRYWERYDLERRASAVIGDARMLSSRVRSPEVPEGLRDEHRKASFLLRQASSHMMNADFLEALERGRESLQLFSALVEATGQERLGVSQAQFISIEGRVEYRRGDGAEWQEAGPRVSLYAGDHVKTGPNGSAEIVFTADGTLYTVRPDTQFIISRNLGGTGLPEQSIRMDYGRVSLNTSEIGGRVSTPEAEARVAGKSEAAVAYDAETRTGRFSTYRGAMEVSSADGEARRIDELEEVVQRAGALAEPVPLLPAPRPAAPEDDLEIDMERTPEIVLAWEPVAGAEGYAVQVSRNHLFVDNVIDDADRAVTHATLGIRGEGAFVWRVAASADGGELGPWSPPRRFRVTAVERDEGADGGEPPPVTIDEIEPYGSIFIVSGRTEPGVVLAINGEPVRVEADGRFDKTIQISKEGWSFIEIRARDGGGNETVLNRRVFVEVL